MIRGAAVGALLATVLLSVGPGGAAHLVAQEPPAGQTDARPAGAADADTLRARILDRVRGPVPAPADTADTQADTLEVRDDPDADPDAPAAQPPPEIRVQVDPDAQRRPPAELPEGADALMAELLGLEGFRSASYSGHRAEFTEEDRRLVLFGLDSIHARFSGDGVRLEADTSIIYSDRERRVRTVGSTLLTPEQGDPVRSRTLIYDLDEARGTAVGAETVYREGGVEWIVRGELDSVQEGVIFGSDTRFTSCDLIQPHSWFQAGEMKVVAGQVLVARSVTMYVEEVPVLWLPFIAQNLEPDRGSGFLTPTFSINDVVRTSTGHQRRLSNLGFYWAMSSYSDATVAFDWFSGQYTALEGNIRYRWARQFLDGSISTKQFWRESGSREFALNTRHAWQASEQTRLSASGRFVSNSQFVREQSLDPQEINQSVDSNASLSHRFNWGSLNLGARRQQFLTDDRVDMTLPSASLTLSTMTLFAAPPQTASWYNNLSVSGSVDGSRQLRDRPLQLEEEFSLGQASTERNRIRSRASLSLGDVSLSGGLTSQEDLTFDVPLSFLVDDENGNGVEPVPGRTDLSTHDISWSTSLSYTQRLIGSTTLTPNVSLNGRLLRSDQIPLAQDFVQGPVRTSFGASIRTEVYGFYPGFGQFDAIRHKITPGLNWSFAPRVTPTELQAEVFGADESRQRNTFSLSFNQTFEARVAQDDPAEAPAEPTGVEELEEVLDPEQPEDPEQVEQPETLEPEDFLGSQDPAEDDPQAAPASTFDDEGLSRLPPSRVVNLLSLRTNAMSYDRVLADSLGRFIDGITTMSLTNDVTSDYLQGLDLSFTHLLFDDSQRAEGGQRSFSPHLSRLSVGFNLSDESNLVSWVGGLFGGDPAPPPPPEGPAPEEVPDVEADSAQEAGFDPFQVIPGDGVRDDGPRRREGWSARLDYTLHRPRGAQDRIQTLRANMSFAPSPNWSATWTTTYDAENRSFIDHSVRLRRDLHEWEASFGFRQTATGNWSFNFEVSLRANRDLRFDYRQRSSPFAGTGGF